MLAVYGGFIVLVLLLLALDLGVLNRKAHVIKMREALGWSALWIGVGLAFSVLVYFGYEQQWFGLGRNVDLMVETPTLVEGQAVYNDGKSAWVKYITGYLVEKSLAIDNIFVIAVIFASFAVPPMYQHRVLFWGIVGALVMRGIMIVIGAKLLTEVSWIIYLFGGFLIATGIKMVAIQGGKSDPSRHPIVRLTRRLFGVTDRFHGQHFFVRAGSDQAAEPAVPGGAHEHDGALARARRGALLATPLLLALIMVELTDVVFAVDSIPAIFAITGDSFLVFASNVMAMLGLRSLYFALAGLMDRFRYLKYSLAAILVLVGVKMMTHSWLKSWLGQHFNLYVLGAIAGLLAAGVVASLVATRAVLSRPALSR